jgi:hypothetical protein
MRPKAKILTLIGVLPTLAGGKEAPAHAGTAQLFATVNSSCCYINGAYFFKLL